MKRRAFLPIGLVALSVLAYAAQGVVLKRTPKVGDKASYTVKGAMTVQGLDVALTGTSTEEVTKVDDEKFTVKSSSKMSVSVAGADQPLPDSSQETTTKLDGTLVELLAEAKPGTPSAIRLGHLNTLFLSPKAVANDETWTLEGKRDEKLDTPAYKITYKLIGDEKIGKYDTYKITSEAAETEGAAPTKIKGTFWINKLDGNTIKSHTEMTDAVFDPQYGQMSGTMDVAIKD